MSLVNVAPPTIVLAATSPSFFFESICATGIPLIEAFETRGIIVVSPWPPITIPSISEIGAFRANDRYVRKRDESKAPPIPITRFLGRPAVFIVRYVKVSIGLATMMMIALGEYLTTFETTDFIILALVPIRSSRVIPGLRGIPEVMTTTSELAVFW